MKNREWCSHCFSDENGVGGWRLEKDEDYRPLNKSWKFCPICATPRPSEPKELWEKIWEWLQTHRYDTDCAGKELAKLSEQHFLSQLEGKEVEDKLVDLLMLQRWSLLTPHGEAKAVLQFIKSRIGEGK